MSSYSESAQLLAFFSDFVLELGDFILDPLEDLLLFLPGCFAELGYLGLESLASFDFFVDVALQGLDPPLKILSFFHYLAQNYL